MYVTGVRKWSLVGPQCRQYRCLSPYKSGLREYPLRSEGVIGESIAWFLAPLPRARSYTPLADGETQLSINPREGPSRDLRRWESPSSKRV